MTREAIIQRTVNVINQLPQEKATEISDFADFVIKRYEDQVLTDSIQKLTSESKVFAFLNHEEDLYTLTDLKEHYK